MIVNQVQLNLENVQGYLSIIAYVHHFKPGLLRVQTDIFSVRVEILDGFVGAPTSDSEVGRGTRRWLQAGETPYPGYCRAPGSGACLPVLCNCDKLTEIWETTNKLNAKPSKPRAQA